MLGTGYKDPDPNFDNDTVNTGEWTGVEDAYREDPSGIGNELNDSLEDKAERAKPTPDNKPAPIGDSRYDKDPTSDNDNDRSWEEDVNEGKTENTEKPILKRATKRLMANSHYQNSAIGRLRSANGTKTGKNQTKTSRSFR